jgi:hypothetical protein
MSDIERELPHFAAGVAAQLNAAIRFVLNTASLADQSWIPHGVLPKSGRSL